MPVVKIVVLILSIYNSETGSLLYEEKKQMPEFSIINDHIEECRLYGVRRGKELVAKYRAKYPYAFANVNCGWKIQQRSKDLWTFLTVS